MKIVRPWALPLWVALFAYILHLQMQFAYGVGDGTTGTWGVFIIFYAVLTSPLLLLAFRRKIGWLSKLVILPWLTLPIWMTGGTMVHQIGHFVAQREVSYSILFTNAAFCYALIATAIYVIALTPNSKAA